MHDCTAGNQPLYGEDIRKGMRLRQVLAGDEWDFSGGVPLSILRENTRLAMANIVKGNCRLRSHMFAELPSG